MTVQTNSAQSPMHAERTKGYWISMYRRTCPRCMSLFGSWHLAVRRVMCVSCFCMCVLISFCDVQARHFIGRTTRLLLPLGCFYLPWQTIGMATSSKWQEHYASWEWQESQRGGRGRPTRQQLEVEASEISASFSQRYFMRIPIWIY